MAFSRKLLNDREEVVLDLHPHWSTLAKPVAVLVVVLVATIVGRNVQYLGYALAVVLLVAVIWSGIRVARRQTTEFVVTTDRLIYRSGVIAKHGKEIPLERVNDIAFTQSVFERMIGTGDLSIESAGAQSRETFADIPKPSAVQNEIYRRMEARQPTRGASSTLSVAEQLEKLNALRGQGVLSEAEFETQKRRLLG